MRHHAVVNNMAVQQLACYWLKCYIEPGLTYATCLDKKPIAPKSSLQVSAEVSLQNLSPAVESSLNTNLKAIPCNSTWPLNSSPFLVSLATRYVDVQHDDKVAKADLERAPQSQRQS